MIEGLTPISDKVIAQIIHEEIKSRGGIIMAHTEPEYVKAKVVAVSKGKYESGKLIPIAVKRDDKILIPPMRAIYLEPDIVMIREHDIVGFF